MKGTFTKISIVIISGMLINASVTANPSPRSPKTPMIINQGESVDLTGKWQSTDGKTIVAIQQTNGAFVGIVTESSLRVVQPGKEEIKGTVNGKSVTCMWNHSIDGWPKEPATTTISYLEDAMNCSGNWKKSYSRLD